MPARDHGRPNLVTSSALGIQRLGGRLALPGLGGATGGGGGGPGFGNITVGSNGTLRGYFENTSGAVLFGAIDNEEPVPPAGGNIRAIVQNISALTWQVRLTPNGLGQASWTTLTLTGLNGGVVLESVNATYTDNSFGASFWSFAATAAVWVGLPADDPQTYTFA